jgi:hypothetical protein
MAGWCTDCGQDCTATRCDNCRHDRDLDDYLARLDDELAQEMSD